MQRRLTLTLGLVMAISLIAVPSVAAHGRHHGQAPATIDLPVGFQPEGLTSDRGHLFAGSIFDGAIWKGDVRSGEGHVFIAGTPGQSAAGIHVDWLGRLWVSGATDHTIRVYRVRTGELLQTYTFPTAGFINDLVITRKGVYATDSINQQLLVVPLHHWGRLPTPDKATTMAITGDMTYTAGFNANGIVARGGWLIIDQTNEALVFRVDPKTGESQLIDLHGYSTNNGDGMLIRGRWLYVIQNADNLIAVIRLSRGLTSGQFVKTITKDSLDVPTTGTFAAGHLYVVNSRFGIADPTTADYWITRLPVWR